jgi:hypothetical protein
MTDTWQDIPTSDRPKGHPSTGALEIQKMQAEARDMQSAILWYEASAIRAIDAAKQLRWRVAELEALVENAYIEGWQHGAVEYGGRAPHVISAAAQKDWRELSAARAALQTAPQRDEGSGS